MVKWYYVLDLPPSSVGFGQGVSPCSVTPLEEFVERDTRSNRVEPHFLEFFSSFCSTGCCKRSYTPNRALLPSNEKNAQYDDETLIRALLLLNEKGTQYDDQTLKPWIILSGNTLLGTACLESATLSRST